LADPLIAAAAAEHEMPVWSLDTGFDRMEKLGFCKLYRRG
jgi:predicted nucleic acid-binding protein